MATGQEVARFGEGCSFVSAFVEGPEMHVFASEVRYTTKGKVQAYVQYQQTVPEGFERLARWPVEVFDHLLPPRPSDAPPAAAK